MGGMGGRGGREGGQEGWDGMVGGVLDIQLEEAALQTGQPTCLTLCFLEGKAWGLESGA